MTINTSKARLSVIDNDPRLLQRLQTIFEKRAFTVQTIRVERKLLPHEIVAQVEKFRPHLVILDLRLSSQVDEQDLLGLDLLPKLLSARCILYSAFITVGVIDEAEKIMQMVNSSQCYGGQIQLPRAYKTHSPQELIDKVADIAQVVASAKNSLQIIHPASWNLSSMVAAISDANNPLPAASIADLLVQLYPESRQIYLDTINGSIGVQSSASTGRSLLIKVRRDKFQPVALKITRSNDALTECQNYRQNVADQLSGSFHTVLEKMVVFWDLAASVYRFIGSDQPSISTFAQYYAAENDVQKIVQPLRHFFGSVWQQHYNNKQPLAVTSDGTPQDGEAVRSLYALYSKSLNLKERLDRLQKDQEFLTIAGIGEPIRNPAWWLARFGDDSIVLPTTFGAITHGDLHAENLFVEGEYSWVIDFERTEWGHIFRDFVELEVDIVTRLLPKAVEIATFRQLVQTLAVGKHPTTELPIPLAVADSSEAHKALQIVSELRKLALTVTGFQDAREYFWGLLFDTIFMASNRHASDLIKQRAILYGSLLVERLQPN